MLCVAVIALWLAPSAPLQVRSSSNVRARFGSAHVQHFRIADHIRLKIEYDASGRVVAAQVATPGYDDTSTEPAKMDSAVVDTVLETIVPGINTDKEGLEIMDQKSGNALLRREYKGCRLSRRFVAIDGRNETTLAILVGGPSCAAGGTGSVALALEGRYGLPEYERYSTDGNVDIGVAYGRDRTVVGVELSQRTDLADNPPVVPMMNDAVVERLINYFAPLETMLNPQGSMSESGNNRNEIVVADNVTVVHTYRNRALIRASIIWK